jgi:rubredoxin
MNMDIINIRSCPECGVLYDRSNEKNYVMIELVKGESKSITRHFKCPVCKHTKYDWEE